MGGVTHLDMNETGRSGRAGGSIVKAFKEECSTAASCESTDENPFMLTTDRRLERYRGWSPYRRANAAAIAIPLPTPTYHG